MSRPPALSKRRRAPLPLAVVAAALLVLGLAAPAATAAKPALKPYVVQPGDTCWNIAARLYGSGKKYTIIHKYNDLGPMPHVLVPGTKLMLPLKGGGPDAEVDWVRRTVKAKPPRAPAWLDARVNMPLWRLYKLSTGDESAAHVVFEDTSELRLRDNALLVIYGSNARKAAKRKRPAKTTVVLDRGTLRGGLAALDASQGDAQGPRTGSLVVKTKAAEVDLRQAVGQVDTGAKDDTAVSVYAGQAKVAAQGASVDVPKDFGTFVEKGKKPEKPRPLPPRPAWSGGAGTGHALVPVTPGALGAFQGRWEPVKRAARYRFELARDRRFKRVIVDATVGAGVTAFRAEDLPPGTYFARVAAMDKRRLEGKPTKPLQVEVRPAKLSRLPAVTDTGAWEVPGPTRLDFGAAKGLAVRLVWRPEAAQGDAAAGGEAAPNQAPAAAWVPSDGVVRLRKPGWYKVEMRVAEGPVSVVDVHVLGATATLGLSDPAAAPLEPGSKTTARVLVETEDTRGRPTSPLGLALVAAPGGAIALSPLAPGRFAGEVPAPPAGHPGPVHLTLRWAAGALAQADLPVAAPPASPPPPATPPAPSAFGWTAAPGVARWDRRGASMETPSPRAVRQVGAELGVRGADPDVGDEAGAHLGVAVAGTWASRNHRAGVSGRVTLWRPSLSADPASSSLLGDVEVGARYAAVAGPHFALAPALRLRFPTASQGSVAAAEEAPSRRWGGELGLVAAAHAGPATFSAREAVGAWADFQTATQVDLVGTYAVTLQALGWLDVAAQLDTLLGLAGDDRRGAFGLTGALRARLDDVRLGVFLGGGLGAPGRARLGALVGGLTLELGYGAGLPWDATGRGRRGARQER